MTTYVKYSTCKKNMKLTREAGNNSKKVIDLYTDGSYNQQKQQYGYGYVVVINGVVELTRYGKGNNPRYKGSNQIPGETTAVLQGLDWINKQTQYDSHDVCIHYDYSGIERWISDDWQAKKPVATDYVSLYHKLKKDRMITFVKVKSHSGNQYNNQADQLAKMGANK